MQSRVKAMFIVILYILIYNTTHPMLRLKQAKNESPAYLLMHKKKTEGDPRIPRNQEREGFEFVIVAGTAIVKGAGVIATSAGSGAVLVAANYLTKWVTGKDLFRHQIDKEIRRSAKDFDQKAADKAQLKAEKRAMKEEQERALAMFHATQSVEYVSEKKDSHVEIDTIREIDYKNNPEDRAWLEDFARKICPSGGFTIEVGDDIKPADMEEHVISPMPNMPNNKPKGPNKHDIEHMTHAVKEALLDSAAHELGEHALDHVLEHWKHEQDEHSTLNHEPEVKSVYQKTPNYSSGKRLEYWKKDYDNKHPKVKKEPTKSVASQLLEEARVTQESKFEEPAIAQFLPQETTLASGVEIQTPETNASRWARDDYYSGSSSSYGSSSSNSGSYDRSVSGAEDRYNAYREDSKSFTSCTLYKNK